MKNTQIALARLERMEQIAADTRKGFAYDKHAGSWSWFDRDEEHTLAAHHAGFATRFDALADAVEPYL